MTQTTGSPPVMRGLRRNSIGVGALVTFAMGGIACLTVAAGVMPTAYAVTGVTAIPIAYVAVAVVLMVFSVGYVAMAREIANPGAFYAFISRGLHPVAGVGAAAMAVVAYMFLQVALYGAFGPGLAAYAANTFGVRAAWWVWALAAWAVVAVLGVLRVDINGVVLSVFLIGEVAVTVATAIQGLRHPDQGHLSLVTLSPSRLFSAGVGSAFVICTLSMVGFESPPVFIREARNNRRTIATATYLTLGGIAVVYALASWAMAAHYGARHISQVANSLGPDTLFGMAGGWLAEAGQVLYLTSLFAAMMAFHNYVIRYMYALGLEGVAPRVFERTNAQGAPWVASLVQSTVGLGTIGLFAVTGWDPMTKLFFWLGTTGGFGVLLLALLTSVAVIGYFLRTRSQLDIGRHLVAPAAAAVALGLMAWYGWRSFATLLGVPPGHPAARWLPLIFLVAFLLGVPRERNLRVKAPRVHRRIGLGPDALLNDTMGLAVAGAEVPA